MRTFSYFLAFVPPVLMHQNSGFMHVDNVGFGWVIYFAVTTILVAIAIWKESNSASFSKSKHLELKRLVQAFDQWIGMVRKRATFRFWVHDIPKLAATLPEQVNNKKGHYFAHEVGCLLNALGTPTRVGPKSNDWGIDAIICSPGTTVVQCKHNYSKSKKKPVKPKPSVVRELFATATALDASRGMLIALAAPSDSSGVQFYAEKSSEAGRPLEFWHVGHLIFAAREAIQKVTNEPFALEDPDSLHLFDPKTKLPLPWTSQSLSTAFAEVDFMDDEPTEVSEHPEENLGLNPTLANERSREIRVPVSRLFSSLRLKSGAHTPA